MKRVLVLILTLGVVVGLASLPAKFRLFYHKKSEESWASCNQFSKIWNVHKCVSKLEAQVKIIMVWF